MIDVVFPLVGARLPRDHRQALTDELERICRGWRPAEVGVHRVNVVAGDGEASCCRSALAWCCAFVASRPAHWRRWRAQRSMWAAMRCVGAPRSASCCRTARCTRTSWPPAMTTSWLSRPASIANSRPWACAAAGSAAAGSRHARRHGLTGFSLMLDGLSAADRCKCFKPGSAATGGSAAESSFRTNRPRRCGPDTACRERHRWVTRSTGRSWRPTNRATCWSPTTATKWCGLLRRPRTSS